MKYAHASVVSIHAPAWGATTSSLVFCEAKRGFNPRSRVGSDMVYAMDLSDLTVSIHAPAWGATFANNGQHTALLFQSTLPRGERPIHRALTMEKQGFQSTLPRGERRGCFVSHFVSYLFQSTLPRGERPSGKFAKLSGCSVSIHAPAWGATVCPCQ